MALRLRRFVDYNAEHGEGDDEFNEFQAGLGRREPKDQRRAQIAQLHRRPGAGAQGHPLQTCSSVRRTPTLVSLGR